METLQKLIEKKAMETLQKLIEKKASDDLRKEIGQLNDILNNQYYHFLDGIKVHIKDGDKYHEVDLRWILSNQNLGEVLFKARIEERINAESVAFMKRIAELRADVDDLFNQSQNL